MPRSAGFRGRLCRATYDGDAYVRMRVFNSSRTISVDGNWSPIQQISHAKGNASRPVLALRKNQLHVAWTDTDGEESRAVLRNATVSQ